MAHPLAPPEGWETFSETERLEAVIWAALPLDDRRARWRYYNFTSTSSIWDSDLAEQNWLMLDVRQVDGRRTVEELVVEMTPTSSLCGDQLKALVEKLAAEFDLRAI